MQCVSCALTDQSIRLSKQQSARAHGPHPVTEGQMVGVPLARGVCTLRIAFHDLAKQTDNSYGHATCP